MAQTEPMGVESVTLHQYLFVSRLGRLTTSGSTQQLPAGDSGVTGIESIAEDWSADRRQVDSNLVGPAGLRKEMKKTVPRKPLHDLKERLSWPAAGVVGTNGHLVALVRMVANRLPDPVAVAIDRSHRNRPIFFLHLSSFELCGEFEMDCIGLGDADHATGFAIQAMDDARSSWATDITERLKVVSQCAGEGTGPMAFGRMDHHTGCFVDDHHRIVFIEDVDRDRFRDRTVIGRWREIDLHRLTGLHLETRLDRLSIQPDAPFVQDLPKEDTAVSVAMKGEEQIDPLPRLVGLHNPLAHLPGAAELGIMRLGFGFVQNHPFGLSEDGVASPLEVAPGEFSWGGVLGDEGTSFAGAASVDSWAGGEPLPEAASGDPVAEEF